MKRKCAVCGETRGPWARTAFDYPVNVCTGCLDLPELLEQPGQVAQLGELAAGFARAGVSDSTRAAYASTWRVFSAWCAARGARPFPTGAEVLADFLAELATPRSVPAFDYTHNGRRYVDNGKPRKASGLSRHLAAIATAHRFAGLPDPTKLPQIAAVLRGIADGEETGPRCVRPITARVLVAILEACGPGLAGKRDRAVILLGVGSALRRGELAALQLEDLEQHPAGVDLTVRRGKTGKRQPVAVLAGQQLETCPVNALEVYLTSAGITAGPVFRKVDRWGKLGGPFRTGGDAINGIVKRAVARVGLDPTVYGGHSLRCGFATIAAESGAAERDIARVGRWRSIATLRRYIRHATRWDHHPLTGVL